MTLCKQTPAAGAGAGPALSSSCLFPACSREGTCPGGSERPLTHDPGQDGTGRASADGKGRETLFPAQGRSIPSTFAGSICFPLSEDRELWENIPPFPQIPSCFSSSTDLFSREFTPSFPPHSQTANTRNVPNVEGFLCMKD